MGYNSNSQEIFKLGEDGNEIGGWSIKTESIDGGEMHINKNGFISSSDNWAIKSSTVLTEADGFISSSNFKVSADGRVTASAALITGDSVFGGTLSNADIWKIDNQTAVTTPLAGGFISSSQFKVNAAGAVTASDLLLTSTDGAIGAWNISATSLSNNNATLSSAGALTLGISNDIVKLSATDGTYRMWAGNATAASAPFSVSKTGAVTASNV